MLSTPRANSRARLVLRIDSGSFRSGAQHAEALDAAPVEAGCVFRKLDSAILMVKAANDRSWDDGAEALNRAPIIPSA
jgi:hypothetical protein